MSIRHLDTLFAPTSVAVIGASERAGSIGNVLMQNLLAGGFKGSIWPVHPGYERVHGLPCVPGIEALPQAPELAVIASPFPTAAGLVDVLGARGTRCVVVIGAPDGSAEAVHAQRTELLEAARRHCVRIVGPNSLGLMAPRAGLNATFAHVGAPAGRLAFIAQSGAIVAAMIDWAQGRGFGFSHIVSLGDMGDVDFGDLLDLLADDAGTDAILLYVESVSGARKFVSAARAASRSKPVLVVKGGRTGPGARAAATHTGALLGADAVYDAVFRRTGLVRVDTMQELFDAAESLARRRRLPGERLAIVTNGGGMAVLAADALAHHGGTLATLGEKTLAALEALLPRAWSHANPVDVVGDADPARLVEAAVIVAADPGVDALLLIHCPTALCPSEATAEALRARLPLARDLPLSSCWVGGGPATTRARELLAAANVPGFATPEDAVRAFMHAVDYRRGQNTLMQTPAAMPELRGPSADTVPALLACALESGRTWLAPEDVRALLAAYGFELVRTERAATTEEAGRLAANFDGPVVLKIRSPDLPHKTDVGGVTLDLLGADAVRAAAEAMTARIRARHPEARLEGFQLEPMIDRRNGHELILGMSCDALFGPVLVFGHGGTAVEVIDDRALALPPLNLPLAREAIASTRISRLLCGARGLAAVNEEALALALLRLSELVCDLPQVAEIELNPVFAHAGGALVLDARVRVAPATQPGTARLAIKPYPRHLEQAAAVVDGRELLLRPIRPEDEPALCKAFGTLTPEEVYLRFFAPLKIMSHVMGARATQIDYDRQMTLMLTEPGAPGTTEYLGSVNLACDPDMQRGEFAILVHHSLAGHGLGRLMMERIIAYGRRLGLKEIVGDVLAQNARMLGLCRKLGFRLRTDPRDHSVVRVTLSL